ncbi:MAG: hypothetical protein ACN6NX_02295 [Acinetobacter sp.]
MHWLWIAGSVFAVLVVLLLLFQLIYQYKMLPAIAEYARIYGNVPVSYTRDHLLYYLKHNRHEADEFSFLKERNFTQTYGFMMCNWYASILVERQLIDNHFITKEDSEQRYADLAEQLQQPKITENQIQDIIFNLKLLALQGNADAASTLADLFTEGRLVPVNLMFGVHLYIRASEVNNTEEHVTRSMRAIQQYPNVILNDNFFEDVFIQDVYYEIFSRSPYLENWNELLNTQNLAGAQ